MIPKIDYPTFMVYLPITKKELKLRVMTVKEEKLLLTARESKSMVSMIDSMYDIIKNCLITEIDLNKLPFIELQYIFLFLRSNSIGNISNITIEDNIDKTVKHRISISIDNVNINFVEQSNKIMFSDTSGVIMKQPSFANVREVNKEKSDLNKTLKYIRYCISYIFNEEEMHEVSNDDTINLEEYIDTLPSNYFNKLKEYIDRTPFITYKVSYKNTQGDDVEITLDTLENFI